MGSAITRVVRIAEGSTQKEKEVKDIEKENQSAR
jgi:hypothetical protein